MAVQMLPELPSLQPPPSLAEPLFRLHSGGLQNALSWMHNVVGQLSASLEDQQARQRLSEEEAMRERRRLAERISALEAQTTVSSPANRCRLLSSAPPSAIGADGGEFAAAAASQAGSAGGSGGYPAPARSASAIAPASSPGSGSGAATGDGGGAMPPALQAAAASSASTPALVAAGPGGVTIQTPIGGSSVPPDSRPTSRGTVGFSIFRERSLAGVNVAELSEATMLELRQLGERNRQLEQRLDLYEEQQLQRQCVQDDRVGLRLEALELELSTLNGPKEVQSARDEVSAFKTRLEQEVPDAVSRLGQELRGELQAKADELRQTLQIACDKVNSSLQSRRDDDYDQDECDDAPAEHCGPAVGQQSPSAQACSPAAAAASPGSPGGEEDSAPVAAPRQVGALAPAGASGGGRRRKKDRGGGEGGGDRGGIEGGGAELGGGVGKLQERVSALERAVASMGAPVPAVGATSAPAWSPQPPGARAAATLAPTGGGEALSRDLPADLVAAAETRGLPGGLAGAQAGPAGARSATPPGPGGAAGTPANVDPAQAINMSALLQAVSQAGQLSENAVARVQDMADEVRKLQDERLQDIVDEVEELRGLLEEHPKDPNMGEQLKALLDQVADLSKAMEVGSRISSPSRRSSDPSAAAAAAAARADARSDAARSDVASAVSTDAAPPRGGAAPPPGAGPSTGAAPLGAVGPSTGAAAVLTTSAVVPATGGSAAAATGGGGAAAQTAAPAAEAALAPAATAPAATAPAATAPAATAPAAQAAAPPAGTTLGADLARRGSAAASANGEATPSRPSFVGSERSEARTPKNGSQVEQQIRALSKEVQSLRDAFEQRQTTEALASEVQTVLQALPQREAALLGQVQHIAERAASAAVAKATGAAAAPLGGAAVAVAAAGGGDVVEAATVGGAAASGAVTASAAAQGWPAQVEARLASLEAGASARAAAKGSARGPQGRAAPEAAAGGKKRQGGAAPKGKKASFVAGDEAVAASGGGGRAAPGGAEGGGSGAQSTGEAIAPSGAASAAADAAVAVAQIRARAEELERHFDEDSEAIGGGDGGTGSADGEGAGPRVAMLEARVEALTTMVEGIRSGFRDGMSQAGSDVGIFETAMPSADTGGADATTAAGVATGGVAGASGRVGSAGTAMASVDPSSRRSSGAGALNQSLKDGVIKELTLGLQGVKQQLLGSSGRGLKAEITDELDRRGEARLSTAWTELKGFADAAATRADQVERGLGARVAKVETGLSEMQKRKKGEKELEQLIKEQQKHIEWLTWRISWLEWATKGEERGFGRPLDSKAILPPPSTAAATAFAQPLTEDVELWARESNGGAGNGRQRLRRPIQVPIVEPGGAGNPGTGLASSIRSLSQPTLQGVQPPNPRQLANTHGRLPTIA